MLTYSEKGPLVVFKGFSGKRPDYLVTINRKNLVGDPETSAEGDSLHFVNVTIKVSEKVIGNKVREAGERVLNMPVSNYDEVKMIVELLTTDRRK